MTETILVLDTETTGADDDDALVEIGGVEIGDDGSLSVGINTLVNPARKIPPVAMGIHHITNDMVSGFPFPPEAIGMIPEADFYCAHNAAFDRHYLPSIGSDENWICTMRCAKHIWPDAPGYSNQTLRYWLELESPPESAGHPHRAIYDAYTTAFILKAMLKDHSPAELAEKTNTPVMLKVVAFGKHKGKDWELVDPSYISWMKSQGEKAWDVDTWFTINNLN